MTLLLDPTAERKPVSRPRAARVDSLRGKRVALLDISKPRGNVFLDRLEERLHADGAATERFMKPTFSKPAPIDLRKEIASRSEVLIEALAD